MEPVSAISLVVSGAVAFVQIVNFFENRSERTESKKKVFAKAEDVQLKLDVITNGIETKFKELEIDIEKNRNLELKLATKVIAIVNKVDIISERLDNEIKNTGKLLDKLDEDLEELMRNK